MIYGIGNDILEYSRIQKIYQKHPNKFAHRILSGQEYILYQSCSEQNKPRFIAKRFAYKEAIVKSMGIGLRYGLRFQDFSILPNTLGKPVLTYTDKAKQVLAQLGISTIHVNISDEKHFVFAMAVAEAEA
jgi:holo-[acyl-carrier protein] synthase